MPSSLIQLLPTFELLRQEYERSREAVRLAGIKPD